MSEIPARSPRRWGWLVVAAMLLIGLAFVVLMVQGDRERGIPWWPGVVMPLSTAALVGVVVWAIQLRSRGDARRRLWVGAAAFAGVGLVLLAIALALALG